MNQRVSNGGERDQCGAHSWPVMVLAYNEQRHIAACLDSIFASEPNAAFDVYVMANGCTDRTEEIVREYGREHAGVHLISIALGDKCNAWNVFVHETVPHLVPNRDVYFFMDGDARVTGGSFSVLFNALVHNPHAHAASAVPASGRNIEVNRRKILAEHNLVANLYALRGNFMQRLHSKNVRIPLHLEGDDGLISALVKWNLDPQVKRFDDERVVPCADASFAFDSALLTRPSDWKMYWRRSIRYGRSRYEFELLGPRLKAHGVAAMPRDIRDLYQEASELKLRWQGLYTLPNWLALREMRRYTNYKRG